MLYREIIAGCSQIHTKHINTLCWYKLQFLKVSSNLQQATVRLSCQVSSVCLSIRLHKPLNPSVRIFVTFYNTRLNKMCGR
jgi:hypothetical protein